MRTIQELFNELENHPDYIYASVWTKNDVVNNISDNLEEYLIDTFDYDEIDPEWLEKTSLQFVNDNKYKIQKIIHNYEEYNYVHDCWSICFEDYEFPKYETN
jgi:hypothetical protein